MKLFELESSNDVNKDSPTRDIRDDRFDGIQDRLRDVKGGESEATPNRTSKRSLKANRSNYSVNNQT